MALWDFTGEETALETASQTASMGPEHPSDFLEGVGKGLEIPESRKHRVTFHPGVGLKKVTQGALEILVFLAWV